MMMAYGYDVKENDPYVDMVEAAVYGLGQSLGVGFVVDILPFRESQTEHNGEIV